MYYSSISALSFIITLIIEHNVLKARKSDGNVSTKVRYKRFILCLLLYYITDVLWGVLYENRLIAAAYADTVLYFASMVLSVFLWTVYTVDYLGKKNDFSTAIRLSGWTILIFEAVVLVVNFFTPIIFSFGEDGAYAPGNARYLTLAAQLALFLAASVYTIASAVRSDGMDRRHNRTIGFSGLVMAVFIVLQTLFPLMPFYAMGSLIATCLVHAFITEDERNDQVIALSTARQKAYTDPLTGVKSAAAYADAKEHIDLLIKNGEPTGFAVVIFDLNGLKTVNDTEGHDAGDKYLINASRLICRCFKHSPVYRIGGDEFAAFLEGEDYLRRLELIDSFDWQIERNRVEGSQLIVSSGLGEYMPGKDDGYNAVFERADSKMYQRKKRLKERRV